MQIPGLKTEADPPALDYANGDALNADYPTVIVSRAKEVTRKWKRSNQL